MRQALVNGRWNLWLPDSVADWDAISGDAALDTGWESCRFRSMQRHLKYGDVLFDIGAEHGWISAILAREFVGAENVVLFEPSPEFWVDIRKTWLYNGLADPLGCWPGFVGSESSVAPEALHRAALLHHWPVAADVEAPECDGLAYKSLHHPPEDSVTVSIDEWVDATHCHPKAINIDVEGAEQLVVLGMTGTLLIDRPLVWVSVHEDLMNGFGHTTNDLLRLMSVHGYYCEYLGTDHEAHYFFFPEDPA